ncbi:hypothetical protein DL770_006666 [Monosporascus sp. CRB-9-2]|nr:hypothetical protein DL770_006666 [Monosporascus sp. CRB-9-2]
MQDKQPVISRAYEGGWLSLGSSTPSEFREVENQLYALSSALKALSDAQNHNSALTANGSSVASLAGQDEENARWDTIRIILNNCHETLKHLESFTEKYGIVVEASDLSTPRFKRWRGDLFKNWKKVTWTKEAGALATLRSQVVIHTNSLNLILGVINNSQTARIESGVKETSNMLKEIHAWYIDNLKDVEAIPRPHDIPQEIDSPRRRSFTESSIHTFELTVEIDDGQKPLCGCASLKPDRGEELDDTGTDSQRALFVCCCPNETASHRATVEAYGCIPQLEERLRQLLPVRRVEDGSQDDTGAELTHVTSNEDNHVLALIGQVDLPKFVVISLLTPRARELKKARSTVESATFTVGHRSIARDFVEDVQILLYSVHNNTQSWGTAGDTFQPLDFAEILVSFCEDNQGADDDVESTALKSAEEFHAKLEDMREELFVLSLNYPRPDETVVLHLQSAQVESEDIFIVDASITIVHDSHGKYRLIIVSRNKCTVLSQVLADDFFSPSTRRPSFASPTWLVQIEGKGIRRIYYRQNGLRFLDLRSTQSNRMFELGCSTVSMNQHGGELITDGMDTSEN